MHKMRALVVEDDDATITQLNTLLRKYHVKVTTVCSPCAAYDLIEQNNYDIVFLDNFFEQSTLQGSSFWTAMITMAKEGQFVVGVSFAEATGEVFLRSGAMKFCAKPITDQKVYECLVAAKEWRDSRPPGALMP